MIMETRSHDVLGPDQCPSSPHLRIGEPPTSLQFPLDTTSKMGVVVDGTELGTGVGTSSVGAGTGSPVGAADGSGLGTDSGTLVGKLRASWRNSITILRRAAI